MGRAEYIVHFKGDYSALQKDLAKISAATTKLENDEVIIKLNYDGNIAEFNKQFDKIAKMHPELGIQFQYNVNEKMLNQEINKLKKLTELKLDIDEGNVQNKLKNLASNVEASLQEGLSKDEITKRLKEFFGYYNTSIKAGAKNIDFDFDSLSNKLFDAFKNQKDEIKEIYDDIWNQNDTKEIKLFEIDQSIDNDISKTQERVTDLKDALDSLEKKGASKSGLPSELQKVQDEIKILRADIDSMKGELKNLSGDAFNDMTEQIKGTNEQLNYTLQTLTNLKRALASNDIKIKNSIGGVVKQWQSEEETKSYERYTAFNSQTRETSGAHLAADATGVSMKLMKAAIAELGDDAEGTIHSHPMKNAAFSDDDIERYITLFEESQGKIFLNSITSAEQAMSIDMRKVDISKKGEIVQTIKDSYKAIDDKYLGNLQLSVNEIKEDIMPLLNLKADNPIIGSVIKTIRENFDDLFDGIMNLDEFSDVFEENADYILKQIPELKQLSKEDRNNIMKNVGGYIDLLHDSILGTVSENAQKEYQRVLQEVFAKPEFLKSGETSAIKLEALTDFIDWGSIEDSAIEATKKAADALQKAQDSNSPAELTKPLGKDFGEGYAEGIKQAIPDIVDACKQIVLAAYNAVKEGSNAEDGENNNFSEGFIDSFKNSLNNSASTIQEKIKEILSKLDINEDGYSNFEAIGQNIINSIIAGVNEHSQEELSSAIERIINDAFTNIILNTAVQELIGKIQRAMDYYTESTPLQISHFDIETDNIIVQIRDALDNNTFNINLGGTINELATTLNTSADNVRLSFIDAIEWMREANEFQRNNDEETRERQLFYNSKTGEFSNPTVIGDTHSVKGMVSNTLLLNEIVKGKEYDTDLHWHQDWYNAAPSPQDLLYDFIKAYENGIEKFVVGAQNELTEIDFSKIAKDGQELAEKARSYLSNNIKSVEEALDEFIDRNGEGEGITYYDSANVDSTILQSDSDVRRLYGQYLKAILDNEWNKLKNDFIEKAQKAKYDEYTGNASFFDFTLLQQKKNKIGDDIGNLGLTDIFGESKYTKALSKEIPSSLDFSSFSNDFFISLMNNVKKGIDYTSFDGSIQSIREVVEETFEDAIDSDFSEILGNKFGDFKEFTIKYATEFIDNLFTDIQTELSKSERNEAYQQAGKQALKNISEKTLLKDAVNTYTHDEFEQKYGKGITSQFSTNSIQGNIGDNFQAQLQNAIDESGKYIVKVYGELVEDFKSRLQNAIDETGLYHVDIEGWLYDTFHDGLQRDIDGQEKYIIEVKGRLFDTFKEVLQEAIDGLGAFPIEVKPYMRKGGKIEEVDLPSGENNLTSDTTALSQIDEVTDNIIEFKKKQEETINPDLRNGYERMADSISELGSEYKESEKFATEFLHAIQEIQDIHKLPVLDDSQYNRMQEIYEQFPEVLEFFAKYPQYMNGWVDEDSIDDWFTFLETLPKAKEFLKAQEQISDFADYDERVSNGGIHFDDEYLEEINQQLQQATGKEENFIEKYKEIIDLFSSGKIGEIQTIKSILEKEMPYYNYYASEDTGFIKGIPKTRKEIEELGLSAEKTSHIIEELYGKTEQLKTKSNEKIIDASHLFGRPVNQTPVSAEDNTSEIEAETKAYVKKSDAIEQLRGNIANLKKVEADKLIDENFSKNEKGRFQIEQTALDELIASLKEKKQIEESTTPTTSPVTDNIQSEVNAVNQAIDAEKKKFDELKNKISKTIPNAIETKNKAFEKEGNLVAKIVDDEITYFEVLKDSVDNVTDSIGKQQNSVKDLNSKSKSKNPKKSEDTTDKIDKEALLRQHNTELFRNYAQSIGQKSQVQQDMSAYYAQLEKDSAKAYSDAEKKANSLLGKVKKLQNSNKYTQDFVEKLNSAENELTNFLKELSEGTISFDEVDSKVKILSEDIENTLSKKAFGSVKQAAEKSLTNVGLKIDQIIAKNSAMGKDFESRFKALRRLLESETTIEGVQKIIAEVNKLESELIATGNTGKSFIDQIKQRLRDINSKYIAQYFSFQDIIRYARQAATNVIQLNDAFIELSKVSNTSLETLERDFQSYADIAHDIGGTISDTINATADWARMGYSVPDSKQLAEVAMLYKNVGDGISIDDANSSLISTLQGYQMQADEAEHIVDVFNEVANNYAIDTAGIGEALQRSAASLNAANTSLEESVALVTAANTVVQNPESVGTTFKTLSARIRGASTELEELGEEGDEFTETTSKLQGLIKGLTGFDILEADQKTFKSIYDILIGIGKEWKNLDDIERASLGEALAGKFYYQDM